MWFYAERQADLYGKQQLGYLKDNVETSKSLLKLPPHQPNPLYSLTYQSFLALHLHRLLHV